MHLSFPIFCISTVKIQLFTLVPSMLRRNVNHSHAIRRQFKGTLSTAYFLIIFLLQLATIISTLTTTVYHFNLAISTAVRERVRVQYLVKQE